MANYSAIYGLLTALENYLKRCLEDNSDDVRLDGTGIVVLSSSDLKNEPNGSSVGIYLHRISIDPHGRGRYLPSSTVSGTSKPELPVNLHLLIIGWASTADKEVDMLAWAMQHIGGGLELDSASLVERDSSWGEDNVVQIIPEDMTTEDLLRIWENLPHSYILSTPYVMKTARLEAPDWSESYPRVGSVITPSGGEA